MNSQVDQENRVKNIAVIGAGLVGSLTALQLGKLGYKIDLYEYREDIRTAKLTIGRSINLALSTRGRSALKNVGLEEKVLSHSIPMKGRMLHDQTGYQKEVIYDSVNNECIFSVGRKYLNEILLTATEEYENVNLHFNQKLLDLNMQTGEMTLQDTITKSSQVRKADLIIGCDGAFSTVRKQMVKQPGFNYSQTYIEHGYLELCIPPTKDNRFAMQENYLHIWPRGEFMLIALPNADKSWTVTLFMPFSKFESIITEDDLMKFFQQYFPDIIHLIGKEKLTSDFFRVKPQHLVQIKCSPFDTFGKCLIIGDAGHAVVPFYGQGMNAGICVMIYNLTVFVHSESCFIF